MKTKPQIEVHPVSPKRWADLESLFGPVGADGGCWCMFWRLRQKDYALGSREKNKGALKSMVSKGQPTGVLAYIDGQAVGWCGVSPRPAFARLDNSKLIPASTDPETWSIVCLFINRKFRGQGVSTALLNGAVDFARSKGAKDVEAYPVESKGAKLDAKRAYPGTVAMLRKAAFKAVVETAAKSGGFNRWVVRIAER